MPPEVRAEIKAIFYVGPQAARDGSSFEPADPAHFGVTVQILIGDTASDLADSFDLIVCSPSWFADEVAGGTSFDHGVPRGMPESIVVGSGLWFMRQWKREQFESALRYLCDTHSPAPDWGSLAARIGRQIPWEFDYKYDSYLNTQFGSQFPPPAK